MLLNGSNMLRRKKTLFRFLTSAFIATSLSLVALYRTEGFSPQIIKAPLIYTSNEGISLEAREILEQPFRYLSKGRQSFVFVSNDGKTVLKFFNKTYISMPWYAFFSQEKEKLKREKRRFFYENSYQIAKDTFGEEILYLHQAETTDLPLVKLVDRASRTFEIDLNAVPFVLQRKGTPFYEHLKDVQLVKGNEALYFEIDRFLETIASRIGKQIADADSDIEHNWGIIDGELFHLDPGRLYLDPNLDVDNEYRCATRKFYKWLNRNYPEAGIYFKKQLSEYVLKTKK